MSSLERLRSRIERCPLVQKSYGSRFRVRVTFVNTSDVIMSIYWMDYDGQEVFCDKVAPKEEKEVWTYQNHSWTFRDSFGEQMFVRNSLKLTKYFEYTRFLFDMYDHGNLSCHEKLISNISVKIISGPSQPLPLMELCWEKMTRQEKEHCLRLLELPSKLDSNALGEGIADLVL